MTRVVVCPYCNRSTPEPIRPGQTYTCSCGAVFAALDEEDLGAGLFRLVSGLVSDDSYQPLEKVLQDCQVTVFPYQCDELADRRGGLDDFIRFVRFEPTSLEPEMNLVWVLPGGSEERPEAVADFGPSPN